MTRTQALAELSQRLHAMSDLELANHLTELRLISDECVHLEDAPDSDLLVAVVALRKTL